MLDQRGTVPVLPHQVRAPMTAFGATSPFTMAPAKVGSPPD
jgi:hypothetical protein